MARLPGPAAITLRYPDSRPSPSLENLVRTVGKDIPLGVLKAELLRLSAISITSEGLLRVKEARLKAPDNPEEIAIELEVSVRPKIESTVQYLTEKPRHQPVKEHADAQDAAPLSLEQLGPRPKTVGSSIYQR